MKQEFLLLLVVCVFAAAMVPRQRKAVNTDEGKLSTDSSSSTSTATSEVKICAPQTPCGWSIYKPIIKFIETKVMNSYCKCADGFVCTIDEDDLSVSSYVHHCRLPSEVRPEFS
ncbi:hypothetical protein ACJJTC_001760 [Scirpophaga incertulas]